MFWKICEHSIGHIKKMLNSLQNQNKLSRMSFSAYFAYLKKYRETVEFCIPDEIFIKHITHLVVNHELRVYLNQ